jgi:hypothetical protein
MDKIQRNEVYAQLSRRYSQRIARQLRSSDGRAVGQRVTAALERARAEYRDSRWSFVRQDGTRVVFGDVVDKILGYLATVQGVGAALAGLDPTKAASVGWTGIQYFVTVRYTDRPIGDEFNREG